MNNGGVSARKVACRAVFALGCFAFVQLVGARSVRAESPRKIEGFELLGLLGYGAVIRESSSHPFGVTVGVDFGYTWPLGLRIGTDASYGFGRREDYTRWTGEVVTTRASSFTWGGSVGYDVLLSPSLKLRGAGDAGLLLLLDEGSPAAWFYFGPRVALLWQYRAFEFGLQSKYLFTSPNSLQVGLIGGTRF
jgi:hypothetical protein